MTATDPAQAVAEVLEVHQIEFIDWQVGWDCGCNERGCLPGMPTLGDALRHQADVAVAAARPLIEREAKAVAVESLREFARAQDTWCEAGRAEQVITRAAMRDALLREADDLEAGQ